MTWPELVTTGDWTRLHAVGNGLDCMVIVQYLVNPTYLARTSKARRAISPAPWIYQGYQVQGVYFLMWKMPKLFVKKKLQM